MQKRLHAPIYLILALSACRPWTPPPIVPPSPTGHEPDGTGVHFEAASIAEEYAPLGSC